MEQIDLTPQVALRDVVDDGDRRVRSPLSPTSDEDGKSILSFISFLFILTSLAKKGGRRQLLQLETKLAPRESRAQPVNLG